MDSKDNNIPTNLNKWWHWVAFGPFTPFLRKNGFRKLNQREAVGLIVISIAVIALTALSLGGYI